jgi:peptidoglycan/xylan/chitin deacetylase (PgdA/CDA1 family)
VLLTFDDGLANNYNNVLPVLQTLNAPAIFFVSTQHVHSHKNWLPASRAAARRHWGREENVPQELAADFYDGMSRDQLAECARNPLVTIGSHTVSHPLLTQCDRDRLEFELNESRHFLEGITGKTVSLFAYPTGDYNRAVAEAVKLCGYRAAFAENIRHVGMPAFEIQRIGIYAAGPAYLSLKLSGVHRRAIGHSFDRIRPGRPSE